MNLTLAEAVAIYSQQPLEFEPGTKWSTAARASAVLGRIIEVASGQPYEEFMKERLFRPLEMKDSFFFPPAEKQNRIAMVYQGKDGKLIPAGDDILGGDPAPHAQRRALSCARVGSVLDCRRISMRFIR